MTRNERRQRRQEIIAAASIAALALCLVWLGFALHGALEVAAW